MESRFFLLPVFFVHLLICNSCAILKRDVAQEPNPNILESLKQTVNQFRACLDQALAGIAGQVNVKQLQPLFDALGDKLNKFSKVFEILSSPPETYLPIK